MIQSLAPLLEGCIVEQPSGWRGFARLHQATDQQRVLLDDQPGVFTIAKSKNDALAGTFIPISLIEAGCRPGTLSGYEPDPITATPSGLVLRDHQRRSVTFIRSADREWGGVLLGADPGCGKTISALQAQWLDGFLQRPGLVVGPMKCRRVWCGPRSDAFKHYGLNIMPLEGMTPDPAALQVNPHRWYFIHYEIIEAWHTTVYTALKPASLILDESHNLASPQSKRTETCLALARAAHTERRVLLTGSPIPKTRMDLWPQLAIAQPNQWGQHHSKYGIRYAAGRRESYEDGSGHFVYDGQSNTEELRARLAGIYLRYTKEMVPGSLPKLIRTKVDLPIATSAEMDEYYAIRRGGKDKLSSNVSGARLSYITDLITHLEGIKVSHAGSIVTQAAQRHRKLVVFTWMQRSAEAVVLHLKQTVIGREVIGPVHGKVSPDDRDDLALQFQQANDAVIVCTKDTMGEARNDLNTASAVLQLTLSWNPKDNIQAESRVHRDGNPNAEIESIFVVSPHTVDEMFLEKIEKKAREAATVAAADTPGMGLIADLIPGIAEGREEDLDVLCALLRERED
jgi:superfamily II DNA or RNA helicase